MNVHIAASFYEYDEHQYGFYYAFTVQETKDA